MKRAILFDVYGTLISTGNGSVNAVRRILEKNRVQGISPEEFYSDWKKLHKERMMQDSFSTEMQIFLEDLKELYERYSIKGDYIKDVEIMVESLYNRIPFPETKEAIESLKPNYEIVLASNTDRHPLLQNLEFNNLQFEQIYTSEDLHVYKPNSLFYKEILKRMGFDASEVVFVGDSIIEDVVAPKQLGITTVYVDRKETNLLRGQDYTVKDLLELKKILRSF